MRGLRLIWVFEPKNDGTWSEKIPLLEKKETNFGTFFLSEGVIFFYLEPVEISS